MDECTISDILTPNAIEALRKIGDEFPDKVFDVTIALDKLIKHIKLKIAIEKEQPIWNKTKINEYVRNSDILIELFDFLLKATGKELVTTNGNHVGIFQEHTLNDNFTHKHFIKMVICGREYNINRNTDMLKRTCEYFIEKDPSIFLNIIDMQSIRGRDSLYFAYDVNLLRRGVKLNCEYEVYIEANHPTERIRRIIISLFQAYNIPLTEFAVFTVNELQQNQITPMQIKKKMQLTE